MENMEIGKLQNTVREILCKVKFLTASTDGMNEMSEEELSGLVGLLKTIEDELFGLENTISLLKTPDEHSQKVKDFLLSRRKSKTLLKSVKSPKIEGRDKKSEIESESILHFPQNGNGLLPQIPA